MKLISIQLENIRSYIDETIRFPDGKVLLQGDIGSGKSTILLGIEFALFGVLRGMVAGTQLLRHGAKKGSVALEFEVDKKNVIIRRSLQRSKTGADQDEGFLVIDGVMHNLTPTELKIKILELIGYPLDLLTKSKSLVYRYTVYTPQEDMKRILFDDAEDRINILRRLFDIDKYKRVIDATQPIIRSLREESRECIGHIADLPDKVTAREKTAADLKSVTESLDVEKKKIDELAAIAALKRSEVFVLDAKAAEQGVIRQNCAFLESSVQSLGVQITDAANQIERWSEFVRQNPRKELTPLSSERVSLEKELAQKELEFQDVIGRLSACSTHVEQAQAISTKIGSLTQCPTCLQEVAASHKEGILVREREKANLMQEKAKSFAQTKDSLRAQMNSLKDRLAQVQTREKQFAFDSAQNKIVDDRIRQITEVTTRKAELEKKCEEIRAALAAKYQLVDKDVEEKHKLAKVAFDVANANWHKQSLIVNSGHERLKFIQESLKLLDAEIERKTAVQSRLQNVQKKEAWLDKYFAPLVESIEKQVLTRIYCGFNELFVELFKMLVEDESFSARLDDRFTPIITQGGFETSIENLSGGEKTACALAYRLALTKVINTLVSTIRTNDLLILDEPTDGFSSEQLDRVREVLDYLQLKQIVIVSHEQKMECFVDNVIRVEKIDGSSRVNY